VGIKVNFETVNQIYGPANHGISDSYLGHHNFLSEPEKNIYFLCHFSFSQLQFRQTRQQLHIHFSVASSTATNIWNPVEWNWQSTLFSMVTVFLNHFIAFCLHEKNILIGFDFNSNSSKNLGLVKEWKTHVTKECNIHLFSTL